MTNTFKQNKIIKIVIIMISLITVCCYFVQPVMADDTHPTETITETTESTTVHECVWSEEKWTWTIDGNGLASYSLLLKCDKCQETVIRTNKNKIYPIKNDKTVSPTCTKAGSNFYSVEVSYEGQTFLGTHTETIPATGHSYSKSESVKYETAVDAQNKQYHYLKCTNSNCPDKGKVNVANCTATGPNIAICGKKSVCDICKNQFGEVLNHKYEKGVCEYCKKNHEPHIWDNGICKDCGFVHEKHIWLIGECQTCFLKHDPHEWENGICKVCNFVSDEHKWKDGICEDCQMQHSAHQWVDGECVICLLKHEHDKWVNGKCITCSAEHNPHDWNNGVCDTCKLKHDRHQFKDSACEVCKFVCKHIEFKNGSCATCGYSNYEVYIGSKQQFQLNSQDNIVIKTNGSADKIKEILIDQYPVNLQYIICTGKEVSVRSEFLNRLNIGDHELTIVYSDGQLDTTFTIIAAKSEKEPQSNDWVLIFVGIILGALIVTGIVVLVLRIKKETKEQNESMAEKYARQQSKDTSMQQTQRHIPVYSKEDEEQMVQKIEDEIGMNVSKFLNEDNNKQ